MNKIEIRPRFKIDVAMPKDEIISRISGEIKRCNGKCEINQVRNHLIFKIPEKMQRFWSPELSIEINETNNNTELNCILGPKPSIWTLFATFYSVSVFIGIIGLVFGFSQWTIGNSPYGFWLVPLSVIMVASAYLIALTGQKFSYKEMLFLRTKLDNALTREV